MLVAVYIVGGLLFARFLARRGLLHVEFRYDRPGRKARHFQYPHPHAPELPRAVARPVLPSGGEDRDR